MPRKPTRSSSDGDRIPRSVLALYKVVDNRTCSDAAAVDSSQFDLPLM